MLYIFCIVKTKNIVYINCVINNLPLHHNHRWLDYKSLFLAKISAQVIISFLINKNLY